MKMKSFRITISIIIGVLLLKSSAESSSELGSFSPPPSNKVKEFEFSFPVLIKPKLSQTGASLTPHHQLPNNNINFTAASQLPSVQKVLNQNETTTKPNDVITPHDLNINSSHANGYGLLEEDTPEVDEEEEHFQIDESLIYIRKCCPKGEAFIVSLNSCAPDEVDFVVQVYYSERNAFLNVSENQMYIEEGLLTSCIPSVLAQEEFILFDTGELFSSELNEYFSATHYCLENILDDSQENIFMSMTAAYCPSSNFPQTFDPHKLPVRKCCPQGEVVSSESSECSFRNEVTTAEWTLPVENQGPISSHSSNFTDIFEIVPGYPECVMHERGESLDLTSWNFKVSKKNGFLEIVSLGLTTPSYCIDEHYNDGILHSSFAYVCLSDSDHRKYTQMNPSCQPDQEFCIQKCCPAGELLDQNGRCIQDESFQTFPYLVPMHFPNGSVTQVQNIDFNFGSPLCGNQGLFVTKEEERGEILSNGSLRFISYDTNECDPQILELIPKKDYCYDMVRFESADGIHRNTVPGALICYPNDLDASIRQTAQVNYIYSIFLVISDVFILVSFVIYLTVPDQTKRGLNKNVKLGHSILGRILLSFLFSLFVAYLCLIVTKTASDPINLASNIACTSLGVIMYISFLATFFWLNVLCFELWWKCARQESTSGRRWLWYQFYAWGNPLLLGTIVLYIEFSPSIGPCFVKPNFGIQSCFFSETRTFGSAAKWVYLNGPVALLLLSDLLFFLLTVKSLLQTVQQSHKGTVKRQARQRLKLCFKLFLVMGICWMTEIISAATSSSKWYITEVFNCLQGFIIFLIFILKPKILQAVQQRLCSVCCGRHAPRQRLRGRLTFTASVLSDFLASTKRSHHHPSLSPHTPSSTSSFSTMSSSLSWGFPSPFSSPATSQKVGRPSPFYTIQEAPPSSEEQPRVLPRY